MEAADASVAPKWTVPELYYFSRRLSRPDISFVPSGDAGLYLGVSPLADRGHFYDPAYSHVVSPFPGLKTNRLELAQRGTYALYRRAPIDVGIVGTGWALDPDEGATAIPWLNGGFELWLSSGRPVRATLELGLERPGPPISFVFSRGSTPVAALRTPDERGWCVPLSLPRGVTKLSVRPGYGTPPPLPGRAIETDPVPPPPKILGLRSLRAHQGGCTLSNARRTPTLEFGAGWYPIEVFGGTNFRWMGTTSTLLVGTAGVRRPRARLNLAARSLARERSLDFHLGRRRLARLTVPTGGPYEPFRVPIPAGRGVARLELRASPPAESATVVNPADTRQLAVSVADVQVTS